MYSGLYNAVFMGWSSVRDLLIRSGTTYLFDIGCVSALVFAFCIALACIVSAVRGSLKELCAAMLYAGSGVAVLLASSLTQMVEFFEVMALSALLLIAFGCKNEGNYHAVLQYSCVHFLSGVMLLVGAIQFSYLSSLDGIPRVIFMGGLLINASSFPLSSWVPRAYPQASTFGSMVLPLFTTKVALFVLLSMFHGEAVILYLGILTAGYAAMLAAVEKNIRRLVSYGMVGQMGLLLMSVGCEVIPRTVVTTQLVFSILYQLLFILVMDRGVPRSSPVSEAPSRVRLVSVEVFGFVVSLINFAGFPGTTSFAASQLAVNQNMGDFSYAVYQYAQPILGLFLFMCVGLKGLWVSGTKKRTAAGTSGSGTFLSRTVILLLAFIVLLADVFYSQEVIFGNHVSVYTLGGVYKFAAIVAVVAGFILCRRLFQGKYESAVGEGWPLMWLFVLVDGIGDFASLVRKIMDGYNIKGNVFGVELGEQDAVLISKEPTGLVSSVLLFVMLCICVGMGLCLTL